LTIRNSKLTMTVASSRFPVSSKSFYWSLAMETHDSLRQLLAHCVCVNTTGLGGRGGLWSEKTTVCRIFSCQRIGEALSLAAAGGPPPPLRAPA
jgi:hypothetical protein